MTGRSTTNREGAEPFAHALEQARVTRPAVPSGYWAEVQSLERLADELLLRVVPSRRRSDHVTSVALSLIAATHRQRAQALSTDPELALVAMGLRVVGERLAAVGGAALLERSAESIAPHNSPNAELRGSLLRASWHRLGDRGAEFRA